MEAEQYPLLALLRPATGDYRPCGNRNNACDIWGNDIKYENILAIISKESISKESLT